ncbi:L-threonylcarbamoyladenylate synthase [Actinomyces faecalis]|uniref:L-threonylcarbamoyladenylate synthase n=1 Tax=Actinomyces faecalis TaxID=2722820 RepID=UPI001556B91D|nr:L-threonylcarbamoyladenylate synthase [Actinomyces faecalis]
MSDVNEDRPLSTVVAHVRDGGLVIIPTDTVYGIGTLASDAAAVAHLLEAKGRGRQMPPPVLVAGPEQLDGVVEAVPPTAQALMEAFWPGALTIILDAASDLGWDLGETGGTIAVRMPDHPLALELLRDTGPMAVTSANHTGQPPAADAAGGKAAFPGRVREADSPDAAPERRGEEDILLLDGGATPGPVPSTIISLAGDHALDPVVIRDGVLPASQLAAVLDPVLARAGAAPMTADSEARRP